jgi:ATP-binding protein involved in chromosome partitioning
MPLQMVNQTNNTSHSSIKNILAVAAGKGGVGKSTLTANLAFALKQKGFRVGIVDTDIYGPSIRKILPEDRLPIQKGEKILPALSYGMPIISMAYFRREDEASAVRAPIANSIVQQFVNQVVWGDLDYLLIDFPPGTGDIQLTICQQVHLKGAVMVTTPQDLAVMDVKKAMHLFEQVHVPIVGIVENMSYLKHYPSGDCLFPFGQGGGERLARESGVPFLGQIPLDPELCRSSDQGKSIFNNQQINRETIEAFEGVGEHVVKHVDLIELQTKSVLGQFDLEWKDMAPSC